MTCDHQVEKIVMTTVECNMACSVAVKPPSVNVSLTSALTTHRDFSWACRGLGVSNWQNSIEEGRICPTRCFWAQNGPGHKAGAGP